MTAIKSETLHAAHGLTGTFDGATQMALALLNRTFNSLAPLIATLVLTLAPASSKAQDTEVCTRLQTQLAAYDERHPAVSPKLLRYTRAVEQHTAQIEQVRADIDAGQCTSGSVTVYGSPDDPACERMRVKLDDLKAELKLLEERRDRVSSGSTDIGRERLMTALRANGCRLPDDVVIRGTRDIDDETYRFDLSDETARYRTMCVRSCDGYYFPISFASTPAHFPADAQRCAERCPGADVRLYFYSVTAQESEDMLSVDSQEPYLDHPNAFLYRTKSVASCSCHVSATATTSTSKQPSILRPQQPPTESSSMTENASVDNRQEQDAKDDFRDMNPQRKVRVVGPSFLSDPSEEGDPPVPDPNDAR